VLARGERVAQEREDMAINDTVQLSVIGTVNGTQHVHTLHGRAMNTDDPAAAFIAAWQTGCQTQYRAMFRLLEVPIQQIKAQVVCGSLPLPAGAEVNVLAASGTGTTDFAGTPEPAYMAALVNVKTALAGRRRSGRFFIGGLGKNDTAGNLLVGGFMTRIQVYVDALKAAFVTPALPPIKLVVHSRWLATPHPAYTDENGIEHPAHVPGECHESSALVTNLFVSNRATTMRSRKLGSGI
jgi:hypothetical protein